jgi:phage FluMu protein Com
MGRDEASAQLAGLICFLMNFLGWVGIWGSIGYWFGKTYRKQPIAGMVNCILIGPIGLLLTLARTDLRKKCPQCKTPVPDDAKICFACRSEVPATNIHPSHPMYQKPKPQMPLPSGDNPGWNDPIPKDWKPPN